MKYVNLSATIGEIDDVISPQEYLERLPELRAALPEGAAASAAEPGLPDPNGCAHEIACHTGSITIVCQDLTATWVEADCPDKPKQPDPERETP